MQLAKKTFRRGSMRCPKCNSNNIIYEKSVTLSNGNGVFALVCNACGYPIKVFDYPLEIGLVKLNNDMNTMISEMEALNNNLVDIAHILHNDERW